VDQGFINNTLVYLHDALTAVTRCRSRSGQKVFCRTWVHRSRVSRRNWTSWSRLWKPRKSYVCRLSTISAAS